MIYDTRVKYAKNDVDEIFQHRHGECWGSHVVDQNLGLLWITKNCSSFFRNVTGDNRVDCNTCDTTVVILRDPLERYISGLIHWRTVSKPRVLKSEWMELCKEGYVHMDVHTIPQARFIKELDLSKAEFYLQSDNALKKISKKYNFRWPVDFKENKKENIKDKFIFEQDLIRLLRNNKTYLKLVLEHLHEDYILLDRFFPKWRKNQFDIWNDKHLEDWR